VGDGFELGVGIASNAVAGLLKDPRLGVFCCRPASASRRSVPLVLRDVTRTLAQGVPAAALRRMTVHRSGGLSQWA